MNRKHIQTEKYLEKKTFIEEINLGLIKNEPKSALYIYLSALYFF